MQWHEANFIELAQQEKISTVVFPSNSTLNGRRLVMGTNVAMSVKKKFPSVDLALGTHIAYDREIKGLLGDYHLQIAPMVNTRGFFGNERENPVITVIALQVKRDWKDHEDWNLTILSLIRLRNYLSDLKLKGEDGRATLSYPLIRNGSLRVREDELKAMVQGILRETNVLVCVD